MIKNRLGCFVLLLGLAGCQSFQGPGALNSFVPLEDIKRFPQDPLAWPGVLDQPLKATPSHPGVSNEYHAKFFEPWLNPHAYMKGFWQDYANLAKHLNKPLYGPHLQRYDPQVIDRWRGLAESGLLCNRAAMMICDADLRVLPTNAPCFFDSELAGEGYPFDECQNDRLYIGTPVHVAQLSGDKAWAYVMGPRSSGWTPITTLAWVDAQHIKKILHAPLVTFIQDRRPVYDEKGHFLAYVPLGAQLPLYREGKGSVSFLWPTRDMQGKLHWCVGKASPRQVSAQPLAFTTATILPLLNELAGQPYGWGTLGGYRDCSALVKDYCAAFHIFMKKNSRAQTECGHKISLKDLSQEAKKQYIRDHGVPYRTLLFRPGHIGLYIGTLKGEPMMMHAIWGVGVKQGNREGRNVIGKAVATSLDYGAELSNRIQEKAFIPLLESMILF